jgi:hypothetical protein
MALVIFQDVQTAQRVIADLQVTANIEGGVGPVKFGTYVSLADGRVAVAHPFREVDLHWVMAHANDPGVEVDEGPQP